MVHVSARLTFCTLRVQAGDQDLDGIAVAATLDTNGAAVRDFSGNDANTTLNSVGSLDQVLVDSPAPVPASSPLALLLQVLGMGLIGGMTITVRRRKPPAEFGSIPPYRLSGGPFEPSPAARGGRGEQSLLEPPQWRWWESFGNRSLGSDP
jgi:hypothetical protein